MSVNYVLIFIIIFLAAAMFAGSRIGGAKMMFVCIVLSVSIFISGIIDSGIYKVLDFAGVCNGIYEIMVDAIFAEESVNSYESVSKNMNSEVNAETFYIEGLPVPYDIKLALIENNNSKIYDHIGAESFLDYICRYSAYIITAAASFAVGVLISAFGVCILFRLTGITKYFISDKEVNRTAGMASGLIIGAFFVYILLAAVPLLSNTAFGLFLYNQIKSSRILNWLYDYNIVVKVFLLVKAPIWLIKK